MGGWMGGLIDAWMGRWVNDGWMDGDGWMGG
jgi:hypothetical protein